MSPELLCAALILGALAVYSLSGGADFGGGVWDLLASGPRAPRQRELVAKAIAPIWEANHVWLIAAIVLLFTAFPPAFAAVTTALHVPLTLMLIGIVLRGSAFVFRSLARGFEHRLWGTVFAGSSTVTPVMLGVCVGAVASGRLEGNGFVRPWLAAFPFAVGLMTLALFAYLAAVYLIHETKEPDLQEDFRGKAMAASLASTGLAALSLFLAEEGAPLLYLGLTRRPWLLAAAAVCAIEALITLRRRQYGAARVFAAAQVALIVLGWGAAQAPYLVVPGLTLHGAAAPRSVLVPLLWTSFAAGLVVAPAFFCLYAVFKRPA